MSVEQICLSCHRPFPMDRCNVGKYHCCSRRCRAHYEKSFETNLLRFWSFIDMSGGPDSCWLWKGAFFDNGYGAFWCSCQPKSQNIGAHRFMYEITYGLILPGFYVCHNCPDGDRYDCCNFQHLWLGTSADNTKDAAHKKQMVWGIRHHQNKLTENQVKRILCEFSLNSPRGTAPKLAEELQISVRHLYRIYHGEVWKHLPS